MSRSLEPPLQPTVLVTGGATGIGRAIALKYAHHGWNVVCHYFSSDQEAKDTQSAIETMGRTCHLLPADFRDQEQALHFAEQAGKFELHALVNNAGSYLTSKHFSQLSPPEVLQTFMVNFVAPMILSSKVFLGMKKQGFGRIVNISSIAAKYGGSSHSLHYGASKRALEGLSKTLAKEGAPDNILVNSIRPGVVDTNFHKKFPKNMQDRIAMIPQRKMGTPDQVADLVYFLGSELNQFVTNEIIAISGGE